MNDNFPGLVVWYSPTDTRGDILDISGFSHRFYKSALAADFEPQEGAYVRFDATYTQQGKPPKISNVRPVDASEIGEQDLEKLRFHFDQRCWRNFQRCFLKGTNNPSRDDMKD